MSIPRCSDGWIRVQQGGKWGWIACEKENDEIKVIQKIACKFDAVTPFMDGTATVIQSPYENEFKINYKGEMILNK